MGGEESQDGDVSVERKSQCCSNCSEWEEKYVLAEERITELKSELESKISELGFLQGKVNDSAAKKLVIQDEAKSLGEKRKVLEEKSTTVSISGVVDLTEDTEENRVLELMIENKVLECEKKKAESDVQVWKLKCKELECRKMELEKRLISGGGDCVLTGTIEVGCKFLGEGTEEFNASKGLRGGINDAVNPSADISYRNLTPVEEGKRGILCKNELEYGSRARKQLNFGEETSFSKKIAPATPAGVTPASRSVIDIIDSDEEADAADLIALDAHVRKKALESTDFTGGRPLEKLQLPCEDLTRALDQSDEDNVTCYNLSACKRKRASNIVNSDSESDTDDYCPISRLKTKSETGVTSSSWDEDGESVVRRRLVTLRNLKENKTRKESLPSNSNSMKTEHLCGIPTSKISKSDESEEDKSHTEGGSLDDFIASDLEISDGDSASKGDHSSTDGSPFHHDSLDESGDESDGNIDYRGIIARIGRRRDHKARWEFQADMQAAFGKDPELCMKAVCALYRLQTSDEKMHKATIVQNDQGFNQADAKRYV